MVQASFRLKERDKSLFQSCINALKNSNKEKAAICANELAEIRKIINFLQQVELALERVILRLETVKELSDVVIDLKPALETLQNVSKQLLNVLPEVSAEINEINNVIGETMYSTRLSADTSLINVGKATPAGEQILEEVTTFLERKLAEQLPEPPATQETQKLKDMQTHIKQMVALTATCSSSVGEETVGGEDCSKNLISFRKAEIQEVSFRVGNSSIEEALLEYVRRSGGEINLTRCSRELDVPYDELEKALQSLGAKGKIKIEAVR
ncbi:MAG: hypothetical protein QXQ47_03510 [Candidatus Bathyarchaeia archaeon]